MENVPNLLTAENGYFKKEITDLFHEFLSFLRSLQTTAEPRGVLRAGFPRGGARRSGRCPVP